MAADEPGRENDREFPASRTDELPDEGSGASRGDDPGAANGLIRPETGAIPVAERAAAASRASRRSAFDIERLTEQLHPGRLKQERQMGRF